MAVYVYVDVEVVHVVADVVVVAVHQTPIDPSQLKICVSITISSSLTFLFKAENFAKFFNPPSKENSNTLQDARQVTNIDSDSEWMGISDSYLILLCLILDLWFAIITMRVRL